MTIPHLYSTPPVHSAWKFCSQKISRAIKLSLKWSWQRIFKPSWTRGVAVAQWLWRQPERSPKIGCLISLLCFILFSSFAVMRIAQNRKPIIALVLAVLALIVGIRNLKAWLKTVGQQEEGDFSFMSAAAKISSIGLIAAVFMLAGLQPDLAGIVRIWPHLLILSLCFLIFSWRIKKTNFFSAVRQSFLNPLTIIWILASLGYYFRVR